MLVGAIRNNALLSTLPPKVLLFIQPLAFRDLLESLRDRSAGITKVTVLPFSP